MNRLSLRYSILILGLALSAPTVGAGQQEAAVPVHAEFSAGGELESFLRTLQVAGRVPLYPWAVRGFSPRELQRIAAVDGAHPWMERYELRPPDGGWFQPVLPQGELVANSTFPYGINNGPKWTGKGVTAAVRGGVAGRVGPLAFSLIPEVFLAQNADFEIRDNGLQGDRAFADGLSPGGIDLPQRFGDEPYGRIDAGESFARLDLPVVTAGISTSSQFWGPATTHPLLLGNNAGGFLHVFFGSSEPLNVGVGAVHGRLVWGDLRQSRHSVETGVRARRFMSGLVGVFTPRLAPGLEIGAGRFFHSPWPGRGLGLEHLLKPFEGLLKENLATGNPDNNDLDNQIASVFARWTFPGAGVEFYGEYGREDHNWNSRDLLLEPDHISSYMLGARRVWERGRGDLVALRGELVNAQVSHLARTRHQSPFYRHSAMRQGHTHRGQVLGSAAVYGGAGGVFAVDRYHEGGRWTLAASRLIRGELAPHTVGGVPQPSGLDVLYGVDADALVFRRGLDLTARLSVAQNLNRNFQADRFNLGGAVGVQWRR
jgi:hypothetical protein